MTNLPAEQTFEAHIYRRMRAVARELAIDIMEPATIVEKFEMTVEEWDYIIQHPLFKEMILEEKERWHSSMNTKERIEYKANQILEDSLLVIQQYIHSPSFSDTAKVQLLQVLQKQTGVGNKDDRAVALGERFQITINMGGDVKVEGEHDVTPQGKTIEGTVNQ
jgi:hypothetical protein